MATNQINSWDKELQQWRVTAFPPMQTPRQDCTVVADKKWLLVTGGTNQNKPISHTEVLDLDTTQWLSINPLPKPSAGMTACIIKNRCYLLGGTNFTGPMNGQTEGQTGPKKYVFSLLLDKNITTNQWVQFPDTLLYCCTAVAFGDYPMAIGGTDSLGSHIYDASIFVYLPSSEYVGSMPTPRSQVTCVALSHNKMVILGGQELGSNYSRMLEVLHC